MIRFSYSKSVCCLLHLLQEEILPKSSREFNHVFTIRDQVVLPRRMVFRNLVILPLRRSGLSYLSVRKDNLKLDALDAFNVIDKESIEHHFAARRFSGAEQTPSSVGETVTGWWSTP